MLVPVVEIRDVRMIVLERLVAMQVRMGLGRIDVPIVMVLVVFIVHMGVLVLDGLVAMAVGVPIA